MTLNSMKYMPKQITPHRRGMSILHSHFARENDFLEVYKEHLAPTMLLWGLEPLPSQSPPLRPRPKWQHNSMIYYTSWGFLIVFPFNQKSTGEHKKWLRVSFVVKIWTTYSFFFLFSRVKMDNNLILKDDD